MNARKSNIFGIRHNKTYVNLFVFFSFLALSFMISRFFSPIIESNASDVSTDIVVNPTASVTLSTNTLNFTIIPNESGVFDSDSVVATVDTNSTGGYELYFSSVDNNTSMVNVDSNVSDVISSDFNDTVTSSTMLSNKWGYSLDNTNYLKIPTLSNHLILKNINHLPEAEEKNSTVYIGTKIDSNINAGIYQKDIKFTALAHASLPIPTYTITWDMNDGTANPSGVYVESLIKGRTIDLTNLTPERENYTFAGWSNGTTTFEGTETEANINPNNLDSITMTAQWESIVREWEFDYTGNVQTFTAPTTGYYKLEVWGAQGDVSINDCSLGGYGGYSYGNIISTKDTTYYIAIGSTSGYNGGGQRGYVHSSNWGGNGGGGSDIRLVLNDNSTSSKIIVAGGGGGGGCNVNGQTGGNGGGYIGAKPINSSCQNDQSLPGGGNQSSGGAYGRYSGYNSGTSGEIHQGGNGGDGTAAGGGGGGLYGGGGGSWCGGGGGSGYIGNSSLLSDKGMYQHSTGCTSSNDASTKTTCTTSTGHAVSNAANTGNGYAKITYLGTSI